MDRFVESVVRDITGQELLPTRATILIAVSGGMDSMALVNCLHQILPAQGHTFALAHFNHRLRGRSSDADEKLVRRTAEDLQVSFYRDDADVRACAAGQGISIEMAARDLRQTFLARIAKREGFHFVATAHHADDQAELFLIRACRGAGGDGLSGMHFLDAFPSVPGLSILRPFLRRSKPEIQAWAKLQGVRFREDASNRRRDCQRNFIRHEILPRLRKEWGESVVGSMVRSMQIVGDEAHCVEALAGDWIRSKRRGPFNALAVAIQRQVLRLQLRGLDVEGNFDQIEALRLSVGKPVPVAKPGVRNSGILVCDKRGEVVWWDPPSPPKPAFKQFRVDLRAQKGRVVVGGGEFRWQKLPVPPKGWPARKMRGVEVLDGASVGNFVVLRHWMPGDRYQPLGMSGTAKIQDLFINQKVPRSERVKRWVACSLAGDIVWVEGLRPSDAVKVTPHTRCWLICSLSSSC